MNLRDSIVRGGNAFSGGAIAASGGASLDLLNVGLVGNTATGVGSALFVNNSSATLTNVTVSGGLTSSSAVDNRADAAEASQVFLQKCDGRQQQRRRSQHFRGRGLFGNYRVHQHDPGPNGGSNVASTAEGNGTVTLISRNGNVLDDATLSVPPTRDVIVNGGFETGDFSDWTIVNNDADGLVEINDGTLNTAVSADPFVPLEGQFDAVLHSTFVSTKQIYQSFVVPTGINFATLSWSDRFINDGVTFQDPNQEYRVLIEDSTGNLLQEIFSTNAGDAPSQPGPNARSFDVATLLQAQEGQTLRLSFVQQDNLGVLPVWIDSVSLQLTATQFGPANDRTNSDPKLGPLDPITATHPLLEASTAIDFGVTYVGLPDFDQRGIPVPRVVDGNEDGTAVVDAGAYEAPEGTFGGDPGTLSLIVTTPLDVIDVDDGLTSLREAVLLGNAWVPDQSVEITFDPDRLTGETITLVSGQLLMTHPMLTITGLGADQLFVDGGGATRVFQIGQTAGVGISDISISGGYAVDGGGIQNLGSLNLSGVVVSNNQAEGFGGGIDSSGPLTITMSSILDNIASDGGGLFTEATGVTIDRSTIAMNTATASAGGIANADELTLTNVTVSGNTANAEGGGIGSQGVLNVFNSTIVNNRADRDADNSGGDDTGGGIDSRGAGASLEIANSIISGNFDPTNSPDVAGTSTVDAFSLIGVDAKLASLGDNGGPTLTHAPLAGSAALDAGDPDFDASMISTDQRGFGRVVNRLDLGAVEVVSVSITDVQANEFDQLIRFTAMLNGPIPAGETVSVQLDTSDMAGQATGEVDYFTVGQRQIVFDSTSMSQTVTIPLVDDLLPEANETFMTQLSSPVGLTVTQPDAVGTIIDDDLAGFLVDPTSLVVFEQDLGGAFTVVLNSRPQGQVSFILTPSDPTAAAIDRTRLTFDSNNWNLPQSVNVSGVENNVPDPSGRASNITVSVDDINSDAAFGSLADQIVAVTTRDDSDAAGFDVQPNALTVLEGEDGTFTVVLTTQPQSQVRFNLSTNNPAATIGVSTLDFDSTNWDTPQTVTISGVNNNAPDPGGRTAIITVSVDDANSDDAFDPLANQTVLVTVQDSTGGGTGGLEITSYMITNPHALKGQVPVTFTVRNNGNTATAPTVVTFSHGSIDPTNPTTISIPAFGPGESRTFTDVVQLDREKLFQFSIAVDPGLKGDTYTSVEEHSLGIVLANGTPLTDKFVYFPYDINRNGRVESTDYNFLIRRLGLSPDVADDDAYGDIDGSGTINSGDYNSLIRRFGNCINTAVVGAEFAEFGGSCAATLGGEPELISVAPEAEDVDGNGAVTSRDALLIINRLGQAGEGELTANEIGVYDVNQDGTVSALDALLVINALQVEQVAEAEATVGVQAAANWVLQPTVSSESLADQAHAASIDQVLAGDDDSNWDVAFVEDDLLNELF